MLATPGPWCKELHTPNSTGQPSQYYFLNLTPRHVELVSDSLHSYDTPIAYQMAEPFESNYIVPVQFK